MWWVENANFVAKIIDGERAESSWSGSACGVDLGWGDEVDVPAFHLDFPALAMDVVVASCAQHDPVCQVGFASVFPPTNVMGFAVFGWCVTLRAPTVTLDQRQALGGGEHAFGATQVEDLPLVAQYLRHDARVAGEPA
jgi:hypothetical protein